MITTTIHGFGRDDLVTAEASPIPGLQPQGTPGLQSTAMSVPSPNSGLQPGGGALSVQRPLLLPGFSPEETEILQVSVHNPNSCLWVSHQIPTLQRSLPWGKCLQSASGSQPDLSGTSGSHPHVPSCFPLLPTMQLSSCRWQ